MPELVSRCLRHALFTATALLLAAHACLAAEPMPEDRGMAAHPTRHVLVRATGQGATPQAAEQDALRNARQLAAKHLATVGGAAALDPGPNGQRVLIVRNFPALGFAMPSALTLVEFALRPLPEPGPPALNLPVIELSEDAAHVLSVEANRPGEALVALDLGPGTEPDILPGGGGAAYRLAPGKAIRLPLPRVSSLRVLVCTGGLNAPAGAPTIDESFAKARAGRPRPNALRGVVSECVEKQLHLGGHGTKPTP
jgi:hypothetical protein